MSEKISNFSIHGISAIVQDPDIIIDEKRKSSGPRWKGTQTEATWFHFAIPTPHKIDGRRIEKLIYYWIKVKRDEGVEVKTIHLRDGKNPVNEENEPSPNIPLNEEYKFQEGSYSHQLNYDIDDALCISVLVKWVEEKYITFIEAGAAWLSE